MLLVLSEQ